MLTPTLRLHPTLQNQNCRHLVDDFPSALDRHFRLAEQAIRLSRSQAFVPKMYWQFEALSEFINKDSHLLRLDTLRPAHPQRQPDHDLRYIIFADDLLQRGQVRPLISPLNRLQSLRSDPQQVRYGHADSSGADVQAQNAQLFPLG